MLIKELQSLGLDVKMLTDTREEIVIGEDDDDDYGTPLGVSLDRDEDTPESRAHSADDLEGFGSFDDLENEFGELEDVLEDDGETGDDLDAELLEDFEEFDDDPDPDLGLDD